MTIDEMIRRSCEFYGISLEEGYTRREKILAQEDDPTRPICVGCAKTPDELSEYTDIADDAGLTPTQFVIEEEGTFNRNNGHFLCTECYIKNGSPSSSRGWKAP